ncbi:cyclophilin-like fold protein [Shimia aestuarii]|uniref:cyclophilin-like fold protein n=2 Tax=Shimia TaxID=573139 RepID=UPI001FB472CC|nr:cyclophilin-like fold protein [Shimia aestuarii]
MGSRARIGRRGLLKMSLAAGVVPGGLFAEKSEGAMRIACRFADQMFHIGLAQTPVGEALMAQLPLDLTIEDYGSNEKIAYLPQKLSGAVSEPFGNEAPGDFCYFAPWGNLVFFYEGYHYSRGLIRLGRIEGGIAPLLLRGSFPLRISSA